MFSVKSDTLTLRILEKASKDNTHRWYAVRILSPFTLRVLKNSNSKTSEIKAIRFHEDNMKLIE